MASVNNPVELCLWATSTRFNNEYNIAEPDIGKDVKIRLPLNPSLVIEEIMMVVQLLDPLSIYNQRIRFVDGKQKVALKSMILLTLCFFFINSLIN